MDQNVLMPSCQHKKGQPPENRFLENFQQVGKPAGTYRTLFFIPVKTAIFAPVAPQSCVYTSVIITVILIF